VPMRFWKIALWVEDGIGLRSVALVADQSKVIEVWPEDQPKDAPEVQPVPEAFDDPDELARVSEFLTNVAAIEAATGLDFGGDVRAGDIRAGATDSPAIDAAAAELFAPPRPRARRRRGKRPD